MEHLPILILQLGKDLSDQGLTGSAIGRSRVVALFDSLGVMFLQHRQMPVDSVEFCWLAARAKYLVERAEQLLGQQWQVEIPLAAAVLNTAFVLGTGESRWG
jgi:hypothetical protein